MFKATNIYLLSEVGRLRDSSVLITIRLVTGPLTNQVSRTVANVLLNEKSTYRWHYENSTIKQVFFFIRNTTIRTFYILIIFNYMLKLTLSRQFLLLSVPFEMFTFVSNNVALSLPSVDRPSLRKDNYYVWITVITKGTKIISANDINIKEGILIATLSFEESRISIGNTIHIACNNQT